MTRVLGAVLLLATLPPARAQDERRVVSPDGRIEVRLFVAQSPAAALPRLEYEARCGGRPLIGPSILGWYIHNQEPVLGEKVGLLGARAGAGPGYRSIVADYMQDGSIGRRFQIEARVWNDGFAIRYLIPPSSALEDLLIDDEATEFDLGRAESAGPSVFRADGEWIGIAEAARGAFPPMRLERGEDGAVELHLAGAAPGVVVYTGHTPFVSPWRIVTVGHDRERAAHSPIAAELDRQSR